MLLTFHFVCFTWIFFRAESPGQALGVLRQLATLSADTSNLAWPAVLVVAVGYAAHWVPDRLSAAASQGFARPPAPAQAAVLYVLGLGLYSVASSDVVPFIYARF